MASLMGGASVGFLFGIPKILQSDDASKGDPPRDSPSVTSGYRQQVNTNLTEISDWLTKIIVGLGLINLKALPPTLLKIAERLSIELDPGHSHAADAFAAALIVCFTILGFLSGYISTRLFLAGAFSEADQAWARDVGKQREELEATKTAVASLSSTTEVLKEAVYPASASEESEPIAASPADSQMQTATSDAGETSTADDKRRNELAGSARHEPAAPPAVPPAETKGQASGVPQNARPVGVSADGQQLRRQAESYMAIQSPDYGTRVRLKDAAANKMADFILKSSLSHDDIVQLIRQSRNEGLVLALATAVNIRPEPGDFDRLRSVAVPLQRLHVRYRVVVALAELYRKRLIPPSRRADLTALLQEYSIGADQSLQDLIDSTRSLLGQAEEKTTG